MVGGLGEVLKDWEGKGLLGAPSSSVGGGGGRTVLLEAEDHGSDVAGVKSSDDGFGSIIGFGRKDVGSLQNGVIAGDGGDETAFNGPLEDGEEG